LLIGDREESAKVIFKNKTTNHRQHEIIKKVKSYTEEIEEKEEITEDNKILVKNDEIYTLLIKFTFEIRTRNKK
jgi:hypothetical protein